MPRTTNATFLYTDRMLWEPLDVDGAEGRAWIKTLSKDEQTGARSAIIRYDPGFKLRNAKAGWPADTYVLEGEMVAGDRRYEPGTFHYRPLGVDLGPVHSPKGITRLVFTADSKTKSSPKEVFIQNVSQVPWQPSYVGPTRSFRMLREDEVAELSVLIHANFVPDRTLQGEVHRHDHFEEAFTLEGEFHDYLGDIDGHIMWRPGTYICRVPFASAHGDTFHPFPAMNFIRRGWVGNMQKFHESDRNVKMPVPHVNFAE